MKRYKEISDFGQHIELDGKENWYFVISRNRDSDLLGQSNFECALQELGGESETVEVVRFGHWGYGWIEYLLTDERHGEKVQEIEKRLANYPLLNEEDYTERVTNYQFQTTLDAIRVWHDALTRIQEEDEKLARALLRWWEDNDYPVVGEDFYPDDDMLQEGLAGLEQDRKDARDLQNPYPVLKGFEFRRLMPKWEFERLETIEL